MDVDHLINSSESSDIKRKFSETQTNRKRVIQVLDLFNSKYKCKICRQKLRYRADEIVHSKLKHRLKDSQILCPICKKIFTSYQYLTLHLMVDHLKEKPYGCRLCKKRFYAFISLKRHCYDTHLNKLNDSLSSKCSSSYSSDSAFSFDSKRMNLVDLIDYDNSQIILYRNELESSANCSKYEGFLNKMKLSEIIWNDDLNNKNLNLINISPLMMIDQSTKSDTSMNKCEYIEFLFDSKQNNISEEIFTIITQFNVCECKICFKLFRTNSDYLNHYWNAHMDQFKSASFKNITNDSFQCWPCSNDLKLKKLSNKMQENVNFHCQSDLIFHLQSNHLNEIPFRCSICADLQFKDLDSAKNHLLKHFTLKDSKCKNVFVFACAHCEQIYSDFDRILDHFIQSSACNLNFQLQSKKSYSCDDCGDVYLNEIAFKIHLDQHKFLKDYEQPKEQGVIIRKTPIFVNNKNNLYPSLRNINLSANNKKYSIDALVSSTPIKTDSMLLHSSSDRINEFKDDRNANFSNMSNSAFIIPRKKDFVHNQINSNNSSKLVISSTLTIKSSSFQLGKSSLKCENCGYVFDSITNLDAHKKLHNSFNLKRPYKCHLCQVTFSKTDQLSRHMIVHQASDQDSVCQICFSSFSRKQDLDRHLLFHSK